MNTELEALAWNAFLYDPDAVLVVSGPAGNEVVAVQCSELIALMDRAAAYDVLRGELARTRDALAALECMLAKGDAA